MKTKKEKQKIAQWDLVDNAIHNLIQELNPSKKEIQYDGETIHEIRSALIKLYVEKLKLCTEAKFYP